MIAIETVRLFTELQEKNRALTQAHAQVTETLEQQMATAEILRVISRSQTDVQPVFDTIVRSAPRLCGAKFCILYRFDGELLHLVAHYNVPGGLLELLQRLYPMRPERQHASGRAIISGSVVEIDDVLSDPEYEQTVAALSGWRSMLAVPLLRERAPIGAIVIQRGEAGAFPETQIALIQTFADQAVIAIENARLLTELQARNRDLTESLDRQTATAEILRVISQAQTDVRPVFEAIADSAMRLLGAWATAVTRYDGEQVSLAAARGGLPGSADAARDRLQLLHRPTLPPEQSVLTKRVHYVVDVETDPSCSTEFRRHAVERGFRSFVSVPMLRGNDPLGIITVSRVQPGEFSTAEIALLQTFADQAVIAVENVRLFTELQTSNRELTAALDTQTATSDILRVISGSRTDVQPVFDAILQSAVRLLGGYSGTVTRLVGDRVELAAVTSTDTSDDAAFRTAFLQSRHYEGAATQAILARAPINVADTLTDARFPDSARARAQARGFRSAVFVPLLRGEEAIGAISVSRREPGGFTGDEIVLLQMFAGQAVIAIENARLLSELQERTEDLTRSVGELRALSEIGQAIGSTLDLQTVLTTIVARATALAGADAGVIYEYDPHREVFEPRAAEHLENEVMQALVATPLRKGQGATGRLAEVREPIQRVDLRVLAEQAPVRDALIRAGYRALLAVPLVRENDLIGGLTVFRKTPGEYAANVVELMQTFATQSALAIQNARLFLEIEDKGRQLEAASQHKSEFLANMSHELRTPLNAIIGFSEMLTERMFGELNDKQDEYLRDIYASGQHLLSLINDILDLSKIEAGRMELELAQFHLPQAIENALVLVRERAVRRGLTLEQSIDPRLGEMQGDERKIKQVLLNLLSNAIKFTPDGGRVGVRAAPVDEHVEVAVSDTGVGIGPEDQEAVFEEFRQVGTAEKKAEGTGLGLALARKFIELHGGRIGVQSQVGVGSTFTFTLPVRHGN